MRFCYAHRRFTLYPNHLNSWDLTPAAYTDEFLARVKEMGFDAFEVGIEVLDKTGGSESDVKGFANRLADFGLAIGCVRSGGTLVEAKNGPANRERQLRAIKFAGWAGAEVVNGAMSAPFRYPGKPGSSYGWPVSQDGSREQMMWTYEAIAPVLQEACDVAGEVGVNVSVEVHQNSPVDTSWSALLLHGLVDRKNFGVNPDLGNVLWCYDVPEEDTETTIKKLAPIANYWHCKNLHRINHPENERSVFLRVPLTDGEIDYRFAISAMADADYSGYMAIEGAWAGDQFYQDSKSIKYAKEIWAEREKQGAA